MEQLAYNLIHIPLPFAYLCIDCESIGTNSKHCSACSSTVVVSLHKLLNKEKEKKCA